MKTEIREKNGLTGKTRRLCSYVVVKDTGLAPNPFWGYCALAVCTPNHTNVNLEAGDWIAGFLSKKRGSQLLCAMRIRDVLHFNDYFAHPHFKRKIPDLSGNWRQRCGDNFYYTDASGMWIQRPAICHCTSRHLEQDTRHPYVFVSDHFFYFGENAINVREAHKAIMHQGRAVKCHHPAEVVDDFILWLENTYETGIHGNPIDNPDLNKQTIRGCR